MALATTKGREFALEALARRRKENTDDKKIDNASLVAGSPIYYYCMSCNGLADTKPENWWMSPPKRLCDECQALKDLGWLK